MTSPMRAAVLAVPMALLAASAARADEPTFTIVIKDQKFVPSDVAIPAGVKVKLVIRNEGNTPSEFESTEFHREKVVLPGDQIVVYVGPLTAGSYAFFDDFHPATTGRLIVK